ncbi:MAG TPA: outer membrane protein assembly factor BamD [Burkholderiales bacterium]
MYRLARILALALALAGCADVLDPMRNWGPEEYYQAARRYMSESNWPEAIRMFEQLEARYPYGRYTEQAQLEIAYVHWKDEEPALALAAADRFIRLHPTHPNVDYAYYLKGIINFRGEKSLIHALFGFEDEMWDRDPKSARESYNAFRELVERFPNSRYAKDAADRMRYLIDAQARYEVSVARFYLERGAYVAAVNRCKYALENYPNAPAVEDALGIQAKAYKLMGLTKLADDTARVLRLNFPESRYLREIESLEAAGERAALEPSSTVR